jgi:hypothetical protein
MKTKILLLVSCLANAGLLGAYWLGRPSGPSAAATPEALAPAGATTRPLVEPRPARVVETATVTNAFHWANVESDNYKAYIANLRAIGCPEETIRDIIIADVNKLFAGRVAALYPSAQDFPFWKVEDRAARAEERARERKRRDLEKEKRDLIQELLGIDYEVEVAKFSGRPDDEYYRHGFLSPEKQEQLKALQEKYRELERAATNEGGGRGDPVNRAKIAALRAQQQAEMAQLLGPADYEQYQLRNSWTARDMREHLASFQPTEAEFKEVFKLRKAYDDQFGFPRDGGDEAAREQRRQAQQQLDEQIKGILGEPRYHDYQLAQDERYREMYDFTQQNNLPKTTAETLYDMRKSAEQAKRAVDADPALPPEQRQATLTAIAQETRATISATLPPEVFKEFDRRNNWLDRLTRDARNPGGGRGGNAPGRGPGGRGGRG